ncbi:WYL domain-containing protein [Chromobacterium haemolyticum]|uniref:WYL domain-containing protein n=1 Tax=Chromobacterium fluminis TaxID=3044269 RepID=A0ABX0L4K1_9NEIS|nr:WYL domain-containing protein [Chromobacterium haemolyticum]NHR04491.1 WYL domain-containing protein [Chromobacterium haemolyticum]
MREKALRSDRLRLLTLLLLWEGFLGNARLREVAGLSTVRSSEWIKDFRLERPGWTTWDSRQRVHLVTPAAYQATAGEMENLGIAHYIALAGSPADESIVNGLPTFGRPFPEVFATLRQAIKCHGEVVLTYMSLSNPAPHARRVFPQALVFTGQRWHVRGYCVDHQDYRDFNLGRIVTAKVSMESAPPLVSDTAWDTMVPIRLEAHPNLSHEQCHVIRHEYFAGAANRTDHCRAALLKYVINAMSIAVDPSREQPPKYLLHLRNCEELAPWLFL